MWPDVARLNQTAFDASDRWVKRKALSIARRDYHSLEFLEYAQTQMGQYAKVRAAVTLMIDVSKQVTTPPINEQTAVMASGFAIETGQWDVLTSFAATNRSPELNRSRGAICMPKPGTGVCTRTGCIE